MWVQRSWPGLAGATGEQMRTVGARFNLAKHYRMRWAPVPGKDKLNFSHCASHSSFQWVESHRKMSNRVKKKKKKKKKALDTESVSLCLSCCFFILWESRSDKDRQAHKHTNLQTHRALSPSLCFYLPLFLFPSVWHTSRHTIHTDTLKEDDCQQCNRVCMCVCVCVCAHVCVCLCVCV